MGTYEEKTPNPNRYTAFHDNPLSISLGSSIRMYRRNRGIFVHQLDCFSIGPGTVWVYLEGKYSIRYTGNSLSGVDHFCQYSELYEGLGVQKNENLIEMKLKYKYVQIKTY